MENTQQDSLAQKIEDIFAFSPSSSGFENRIAEYKEKVPLIETTVKNIEIKTIEDQKYIQEKLKTIIEIGEKVLEVVSSEIKLGSPANRLEAFSYAFREVAVAIEKLQNLNKLILDIYLMQNPVNNVPQNQNNFLVMDSRAALKLIKDASNDAKKNSELNNIDVDFDIKEENK